MLVLFLSASEVRLQSADFLVRAGSDSGHFLQVLAVFVEKLDGGEGLDPVLPGKLCFAEFRPAVARHVDFQENEVPVGEVLESGGGKDLFLSDSAGSSPVGSGEKQVDGKPGASGLSQRLIEGGVPLRLAVGGECW